MLCEINDESSKIKKASTLLSSICRQVEAKPESLLVFIDILSEEPSFDYLAREMKGKHYGIWYLCTCGHNNSCSKLCACTMIVPKMLCASFQKIEVNFHFIIQM